MFGLYVHGYAVAVACGGADYPLVKPGFAHDFLAFYAVLLRELLKVKVVQKPDHAPKFRFIAIAKLVGKIFHNSGNNFRVLKMKRV